MDWVADSLIDAILKWFAGVIVGGLDTLWDLLAATVFVSPDVTLLPQVRSVSATSLTIVNTAYVLAILWMAVLVMGRDTIQSRHGPGELIPRLVIGLIGANLAMPLCSTLIQLANAVTGALTDQDITSPGSMQLMRAMVTGALTGQNASSPSSPSSFLLVLIGLLIAVMVGMLVVQWIVRLGVLIVAVGIAPIALALHGTPQTEAAAKLWWRTILGTLGTVIIQAVALHTTLTVFLNPQANLPALGIPADPGVVFNLLVVLCLLWAIIRVPSMMRRYVTRSSPSHAGTILRVVLIQQLTRGVSRVLGRGGGAARSAGAVRRGGGGAGSGRGGDPPWPVISPRGGGGRPLPRTSGPSTAPRTPSQFAAHAPGPSAAPSRSPSGAGPGVVGVAYPTGRPVRPYTSGELARGVDVYTRSLKTRRAAGTHGRTHT